jgi:hypothetical protein
VTLRRQRAVVLTAAAIVGGGLLGWLLVGPRLVDRWVMKESPGSNQYSDFEFARDVSMLVGAALGGMAAVLVVFVARRLLGRVAGPSA